MVAEGLEELLFGKLEGQGRHLGLGVGGVGEEVCAAAPLAQKAEEAEQVGLGHTGHSQFVPTGKNVRVHKSVSVWSDYCYIAISWG